MFTPNREAGDAWNDEHQFLYSLLWSSFLDLDAYSASRFRRRFFPYSTEFVVSELLRDVPEVARLHVARPSARLDSETRLSPPFVQLALWTVVPRLFGAPAYRDPPRSPSLRRPMGDFERVAEPLRAIVADQLRAALDIDVASFRFDAETRPLLPPGLGLGIEEAKISVVAGRRCATAHLSAEVHVQYDRGAPVAGVVDPSTWRIFDYWNPPREMHTSSDQGTLEMKLVLPGGNSATETKWRPLAMAYAKTIGPFAARVDFDCRESEPHSPGDPEAGPFEAWRAGTHSDYTDAREKERYAAPYSASATHVEQLRGYLRLEKIEGRPGWTRFVAEREARFESPNHDRFRVETLMFWLTCDLLSFAQTYAYPKDDQA